jgi:hydroxymethylpyrimidine pyrophosphatase-like HAD family hydrolase
MYYINNVDSKENKMLVVFDIDGTLANCEHRLHHVLSKPKNWPAFDAGIPNDTVIPQVAAMFFTLRDAGHDIVFATGRNDRSRDDTVAWLTANDFWCPLSHLYMRSKDDYRSDDIVKRELLDDIVADFGKKPDMVFEDRPRVVKMWRDNGIFVFDVKQKDENF